MNAALVAHENRVNKTLNTLMPCSFIIFWLLTSIVLKVSSAVGAVLLVGAAITFLCRFIMHSNLGFVVKYIHSFVVSLLLCFLMVTMEDGNRGVPVTFFVLLFQVTLFYNVRLIIFNSALTLVANLITGFMYKEIYFLHQISSSWLFLSLLYILSTVLAVYIAKLARELVVTAEQKQYEAEESAQENIQLREGIDGLVRESFQAGDSLTESSKEISLAIDELGAVIQNLANNTGKVGTSTDSIYSEAVQMDRISIDAMSTVKIATASMGTIKKSSDMSLEHMEKLQNGTKQIEAIVDLISDIADRTNLLALNAALEAARAGEQGKGFAVVSDEIRALAEQTKSSTDSVLQIAERLVQQTHDFTNTLKANGEQIREGVDAVSATADALGQISDKVSRVTREISEISLSIQELSSGSEEMAASSEQQVAQIKLMATAIEDLTMKLHNILGLVSR